MDTTASTPNFVTRFALHFFFWGFATGAGLALHRAGHLAEPTNPVAWGGAGLLTLAAGSFVAEIVYSLLFRSVRSLIRREFSAYFLSPIAYVVLTVFLLGTGLLYLISFRELTSEGPRGIEYPLGLMLGNGPEGMEFPIFWMLFLFIPPLLTMRLFAEERGSGTMEMLMTAPIQDWQIVFSKFVACFGFYILMWLPTLLYLPILLDLQATWDFGRWTPYGIAFVAGLAIFLIGLIGVPMGWMSSGLTAMAIGGLAAFVGGWLHFHLDPNPIVRLQAGNDPWPVLTTGIGVLLAGAMFLAMGLFISSLVKGQMVAALLSITFAVPLIFFTFFLPYIEPGSWPYRVTEFFTVPQHFARDFTRGILDTRHLIFYFSATLFFLFLTVRSVESKRR